MIKRRRGIVCALKFLLLLAGLLLWVRLSADRHVDGQLVEPGFHFSWLSPSGKITATNPLSFPVGEVLVYKLYWGVIPVGEAEFSSQWVDYYGKQMIGLRAKAKTTSVVRKLYPVDDIVESIVDPGTFFPVRYWQRLREGGYNRDDMVLFDHSRQLASWSSAKTRTTRRRKKKEQHSINIDKDTRDVLSLAYAMRGTGLAVGEKKSFRVVMEDKIYDLDVEGVRFEDVNVNGYKDKIRCLEVEPRAKFGGIFVRNGRVRLWFSDDSRRICVRMVGKVPLANVKAILQAVKGPKAEEWQKEKR